MAETVAGRGGTNGSAAEAEATSCLVSFTCQTEVVSVGVLTERLKEYAQGGFSNRVLLLDGVCYAELLSLVEECMGSKAEGHGDSRAEKGTSKWTTDLEKRFLETAKNHNERKKKNRLGYLSSMPTFSTVLKSRVKVDKDGNMCRKTDKWSPEKRIIPLENIPSYAQEWKKSKQDATFDDFVAHCEDQTSLNKAVLAFWKKDWEPPKSKTRANSKRPRDEHGSDEDLESHSNKKASPQDPNLAAEDLPLQLGNGEAQQPPVHEPVTETRNNSNSGYNSSGLNGNNNAQQSTHTTVQLNIFVGNDNYCPQTQLFLRHQHYVEQLRQHGLPEPSLDELYASWFAEIGIPFQP